MFSLVSAPITSDKKAVIFGNHLEQSIDLPRSDTWVYVQVTAINNPSNFYVIFPYGSEPVEDVIARASYTEEEDRG